MSQYSKAQILTLIGDNLPNNYTNEITPEDLREVLIKFSDMLQDADLIAYAHDNLSGVTEVKSALDTIVAALSDTDDNLMTGKLIVALLSALSGTNRLPKTALNGADKALNRRGKMEFDNQIVQSSTLNVKEGDWFEWTEGESPAEGDFDEGDVAISLTNTPSVPWALEDPLFWRIYRFSKLDSFENLTAAEIRDALETLTETNRLPKTAIFGADRALNRRGKSEFDNDTVQIQIADVKEGDWFEWTEGGSPTEGDFAEGDVAISLTNTPSVPWALNDPSYWRIYRFSKLDSFENLTAAEIRDALETLTGTNMLNGDKVKYDDDYSVKGILDRNTLTSAGLSAPGGTFTAIFDKCYYYTYTMSANLTITQHSGDPAQDHFPLVKIFISINVQTLTNFSLSFNESITHILGEYDKTKINIIELEYINESLTTAKIYQKQ